MRLTRSALRPVPMLRATAAAAALAVLTGPLVASAPAATAAVAPGTHHGERGTSYASAPSAQRSLPSKKQWYADVRRAMRGSQAYLDQRVAEAADSGQGEKLAINLDIDNTSIATQLDHSRPIPVTLAFARKAESLGVTLLFNTGRQQSTLADVQDQLEDDGYHPAEMCGRQRAGERLAHSKQRCRQHYVDEGYTIVANVGNRSTDFVGSNYERAFRLPNYHNQLS